MKIERVKFEEFPGGIVKASVSGCRFDAMDKINGKFVATTTSAIEFGSNVWSKAHKHYIMNDTYSAIARCAPEDEYNFEVGKKIAMKKLNDKYHRSLDRRIVRFKNDVTKMLQNVEQYFEYKNI